jgi:hypothetical protein
MTIRIYQPKLDEDLLDPRMFFDINNQEYEIYSDSIDNPQIILLNHHLPWIESTSKIKLFLEIWHNFENQADIIKFQHENNNNDCYTITNIISPKIESNPNIIFNDFLFNRTKAYYSQFPFRSNTKKWYYNNQLGYLIPNDFLSENKNKIYVAPNKNHLGRIIKYRPQIAHLLNKNYRHLGYIGNITDDPSLVLHPHDNWPFYTNIQAVENIKVQPSGIAGYSPPHNEYYKNTFISIYAETIEWGNTIAVTEKTYDPLIKGHFILPFSTSGFIAHLKFLGFEFPGFIDYSYDNITDDKIRFEKYQDEIHRLLSISVDQWRVYWDENFKTIRHNQLVFCEKPYDRIDFNELIDNR